MAYDEELARRIRESLSATDGVVEKRMFGGLAFMVEGRMAIAANHEGGILLRVDPERAERLVEEPHVGRMVMRGREMAGWLRIDAEGVATRDELTRWVELALRG